MPGGPNPNSTFSTRPAEALLYPPSGHAVLDIDAVIAVRLTGRLLGPESNRAALDVLKATPGNRNEAPRQFAPCVAQMPEASLR